jgi:M6 family metalloprotease-like protein
MAAKERAIRRSPHVLGRCRPLFLSSALALAGLAHGIHTAAAQQPAQLPAPWGMHVAPPAAILGLSDAPPVLPLEFSRAWLGKVESVRQRREALHAAGGLDGVAPESLAAQGAALTGRLRIPVIPVRYADAPVPFHHEYLQRRLFGSSEGDTASLSDYWREVSGGLLEVEGEVLPWVTLRRPAQYYLPAENYGWSSFGRVVELRREVLAAVDSLFDFSQFDNDGPDGIPNSGDDDGFVDFIAIVYAMPCPGDGRAGAIWPHRAAMPPFATSSIGAAGEPIRIADYVILPALDSRTCDPMTIGVLAHETGHALGLPDLYDYDGSSAGIGAWGLMGTGSHAEDHSPAHLSAWSKEQLGWVSVEWLARMDSTLVLEPVQRGRTVYRFDGRDGDYLLLENRQRKGTDRFLPGAGLLIWHVDPERAELGAWNTDERRAAVSLVQADGRNDLGRGRRADAGDPFPGSTDRGWFRSHMGGGIQLTGIEVEDDVRVRAYVVTGAADPSLLPEPGSPRMTALAGGAPVRQVVEVRRTGGADFDWEPEHRARWLRIERNGDVLSLRAAPGRLVAGTYTDTIRFVGAGGVLAEVPVTFYIASPGVGQVVATALPWSWGVAVHGGRILKASYGWDPLGLRPRPRVLQLREGSTHPQTLTRLAADALYAPIVDPRDGATFVLARARDRNFLYEVRADGSAAIVAADVGVEPAYGAAILPDGSIAVAKWNGDIARVTRDGDVHPWMSVGTNIYQIATDSEGNVFAATYAGDVLRIAVDGARRVLETGFGPGRLVTIATTASGGVVAAERGGQGRVLHMDGQGGREEVYRSPGARFYGLAVDGSFLFALDLAQRHLLRIPLPQPPARLADAPPGRQRMYTRNSAATTQQ